MLQYDGQLWGLNLDHEPIFSVIGIRNSAFCQGYVTLNRCKPWFALIAVTGFIKTWRGGVMLDYHVTCLNFTQAYLFWETGVLVHIQNFTEAMNYK